MSQQRSLSTDESSESLRKRVCKACDRCRLKKSKCDGASPCSRCKADNSICVFGERKKSHDKVYPKGYVQMLEQQQNQLVSGLQELYRGWRSGKPWNGPGLSEEAGHPLTHDILAALNLIEHKHDGSGEVEQFEEDCEKLQSRLFKQGAPRMRRKGSSISTNSDRSQRNSIATAQTTPDITSAAVFKDSLHFSPSPSPFAQSPAAAPPPRQRRSIPSPAQQSSLHHQSNPLSNDPQFFSQEWSLPQIPDMLIRSKFALQTPSMQQHNNFADEGAEMFRNDQQWMATNDKFDPSFNAPFLNPYGGSFGDFGTGVDPMELDFNRYIQVSTS